MFKLYIIVLIVFSSIFFQTDFYDKADFAYIKDKTRKILYLRIFILSTIGTYP